MVRCWRSTDTWAHHLTTPLADVHRVPRREVPVQVRLPGWCACDHQRAFPPGAAATVKADSCAIAQRARVRGRDGDGGVACVVVPHTACSRFDSVDNKRAAPDDRYSNRMSTAHPLRGSSRTGVRAHRPMSSSDASAGVDSPVASPAALRARNVSRDSGVPYSPPALAVAASPAPAAAAGQPPQPALGASPSDQPGTPVASLGRAPSIENASDAKRE